MRDVYIVGASRSPIASVGMGKVSAGDTAEPVNFSSISSLLPEELAAQVLRDLFARSGLTSEQMEFFFLGSAISQKTEHRTLFQNPAKHTLRTVGRTRAVGRTVEKACSTGLLSVWCGAKKIMLGKAELVLVGGLDMMSRQTNSVLLAGLTDPSTGKLMVQLADRKTRALGFNREDHDRYAFESYQFAKAHLSDHVLVPISLPGGTAPVLTYDEEVDKYYEKAVPARMARLRPYPECEFMTILNSSKYGDAAAFLVLASEEAVRRHNLKPIARLVGFEAYSEREPEDFIIAPEGAIGHLLIDAKMSPEAVDCFEVNEAFPTSCISLMKKFDIPRSKISPWGGAIAHGHPIGATGALLLVKLLTILRKEQKRFGVVSLCNAISEATAMLVEVL